MHSPCGSGSLNWLNFESNYHRTIIKREITYCDHRLRRLNAVNTVCEKCNGVFSFKEVELNGWSSRVQIPSTDY